MIFETMLGETWSPLRHTACAIFRVGNQWIASILQNRIRVDSCTATQRSFPLHIQ